MLKTYLLIGVLVYIWAHMPMNQNGKPKPNEKSDGSPDEIFDGIIKAMDVIDELKEESFEAWLFAHIGIFTTIVIFWPTQLIGYFLHTKK